jgi:hypothetical protein
MLGSHLRVYFSGQQVKLVLLPSRVRPSMCTSVTPAVSYLSIGLAGCSVDPRNSRDTRKLTRTPRVIKKKNNNNKCLVRENSQKWQNPFASPFVCWAMLNGNGVFLCTKHAAIYALMVVAWVSIIYRIWL